MIAFFSRVKKEYDVKDSKALRHKVPGSERLPIVVLLGWSGL